MGASACGDSSVPGSRVVVATLPTTWPAWLAGIITNPVSALTRTPRRSSSVRRCPGRTIRATATTSVRLPARRYPSAPVAPPTRISSTATTARTGLVRRAAGAIPNPSDDRPGRAVPGALLGGRVVAMPHAPCQLRASASTTRRLVCAERSSGGRVPLAMTAPLAVQRMTQVLVAVIR